MDNASVESGSKEEKATNSEDPQVIIAVKNEKTPLQGDNGGMRNFLVISASYLMFTLTDGALRMVVLFQAFLQGFTPLQIALVFILYEGLSIFTNIIAGMLGSHLGLKFTLLLGIIVEIISIAVLTAIRFTWPLAALILYIAIAQALSGIAKDLVKVSGKSMAKLVTSDDAQTTLFKIVAFLTGAKNAMKGFGYFLGSLLIYFTRFIPSLLVMIAMMLAVIPGVVFFLDKDLGKSSAKISLKNALNKGWNVNFLSSARFFLFGSRDLWFEIALPIFLRGYLGWSYPFAGGFLALWIILYGGVQSTTPQLVLAPIHCNPPAHNTILYWTASLIAVSIAIAIPLHFTISLEDKTPVTIVIVIGLAVFAVVFAVNSSIHSYLILAYTNKDKVATSVGFYYMANAGGRLTGTLLSGIFYQYYGLETCLWTSAAFLFASTVLCYFLRPIPSGVEIKDWE